MAPHTIILTWRSFHTDFFYCNSNSNSMENWFWCNSIAGYDITTKFYTWHVHVQNSIVITWPQAARMQNEISIKFESWWKKCSWNGPLVLISLTRTWSISFSISLTTRSSSTSERHDDGGTLAQGSSFKKAFNSFIRDSLEQMVMKGFKTIKCLWKTPKL